MNKDIYLKNTYWIFIEKFGLAAISFLIGILVIRYLGPEKFGLLSYSLAVVSFFYPLANLGLNGMIQRELLQNKNDSNIIVVTVFFLKTLAGTFLSLILLVYVFIVGFGDDLLDNLVIILALGLVTSGTTTVFHSYFQSNLISKHCTTSVAISTFIASALKIFSILSGAFVNFFAIINIFQRCVLGFVSYVLYKKESKQIVSIKLFDKKIAKKLLKESLWYCFTAFFSVLVLQIDKIMIGSLMSVKDVGIYSSVITLIIAATILPNIVMTTIYPLIIKAKMRSNDEYKLKISQSYNILTVLSVLIAAPLFFLSDFILVTVYGEVFNSGSDALSINAISLFFIFNGLLLNRHMIIEKRNRLILIQAIIGTIVNIIANYLLIKSYGIVGASIATLFTFMTVNYLFCFAIKDLRFNAINMHDSILNIHKTILFMSTYLKGFKYGTK
jgi:O-antigen/teichoic acid export membrane protein